MNAFLARFQEFGPALFMESLQVTLGRPITKATRARLVALDDKHVELEVTANDLIAADRGAGPFEHGALGTIADLAAEIAMLAVLEPRQSFRLQRMFIQYLSKAQHVLTVLAEPTLDHQANDRTTTISVSMKNLHGDIVCIAEVVGTINPQ